MEVVAKKTRKKRNTVIEEFGERNIDIDDILDSDGLEVSCSISRTVQPVQFESIKVEVGVKLPCTVESIKDRTSFEKAFAICREEVEEQLRKGV